MGWFGDTQQSVLVVQANGKSTASIDIPVPLWEVIIITAIVTIDSDT
jgi:hypothetical protein